MGGRLYRQSGTYAVVLLGAMPALASKRNAGDERRSSAVAGVSLYVSSSSSSSYCAGDSPTFFTMTEFLAAFRDYRDNHPRRHGRRDLPI